MNLVLPPSYTRRRFTVAEIDAMVEAGILDEDERVELIHGELVPMSAKGCRHELLKNALNRRWGKVCPDDVAFGIETTFRLSADTYLEPDFVVYPSSVGLVGITGPNVLLVVEISDTSKRYDRGLKAQLYAEFGIRDYWSIDAEKLTTRVYGAPPQGVYAEVADFSASARLTPRLAPEVLALRLRDLTLV